VNKLFVKPAAASAVVRFPETGEQLAAEGAQVPATPYWLRRLRDGDVVEVTPAAPPAPSAPVKGDA
jgi:hypothetical protein